MNGKHTRGPWVYEPTPNSPDPEAGVPEKCPFWIAGHDGAGEVVALVIDTSRDEAEANARLIAAAPDLYAAIDGAMQYLDGTIGPCDEDCDCLLHTFHAALAKARGAA